MDLRRFCAALTVLLTPLMGVSAAAQPSSAALVGPLEPGPPVARPIRPLPNFRMPDGDLRQVGEPRRGGLIGAVAIDDRLQIGIGRFAVPEIARPRTHMESDRHPTGVRQRDRGIAAVGFSLSF